MKGTGGSGPWRDAWVGGGRRQIQSLARPRRFSKVLSRGTGWSLRLVCECHLVVTSELHPRSSALRGAPASGLGLPNPTSLWSPSSISSNPRAQSLKPSGPIPKPQKQQWEGPAAWDGWRGCLGPWILGYPREQSGPGNPLPPALFWRGVSSRGRGGTPSGLYCSGSRLPAQARRQSPEHREGSHEGRGDEGTPITTLAPPRTQPAASPARSDPEHRARSQP